MKGAEIVQESDEKRAVKTAMTKHRQHRKAQKNRESLLQREFSILLKRARELEPPMSIYEIEKLTGVPKSTVYDCLRSAD
jgi:Fic family protein